MLLMDRQFLERRVEDELAAAQAALHPAAVKAHYHLLGYYLDKLFSAAEPHAAE